MELYPSDHDQPVTSQEVTIITDVVLKQYSNRWGISLNTSLQIVYDECHKAKNVCPVGSSKPTKTGLAVLELQNKLPKARVVYASATGQWVFYLHGLK